MKAGDRVRVKKGKLTAMTRKFIGMEGKVSEKIEKMGSTLFRVTFYGGDWTSSAVFFEHELVKL